MSLLPPSQVEAYLEFLISDATSSSCRDRKYHDRYASVLLTKVNHNK
jgi:hypothetical protein